MDRYSYEKVELALLIHPLLLVGDNDLTVLVPKYISLIEKLLLDRSDVIETYHYQGFNVKKDYVKILIPLINNNPMMEPEINVNEAWTHLINIYEKYK
jgi:hypothetical protein